MTIVTIDPDAAKAMGVAPFDAARYLDCDDTISEYLNLALDSEDPGALLDALRTVARARGMRQLATSSGLGRESLYRMLRPGAKPRYDSLLRIIRALGVHLRVESHTALPQTQ